MKDTLFRAVGGVVKLWYQWGRWSAVAVVIAIAKEYFGQILRSQIDVGPNVNMEKLIINAKKLVVTNSQHINNAIFTVAIF